MLHAHPRVFSHGEVFLRYERRYAGRRRRPDPMTYLARDMLRAGRRHFVFSVHFLHGQHLRADLVDLGLEEFLDAARERGVGHVALLERRNSLRVLLSSLSGHARERWHVPSGEETERVVLDVDPAAVEFARVRLPLLAWLETFERGYEEARAAVAARGGLHLTYEEDVLPDPRIGYGRLCARLGVPPVDAPVPLRRANPFPIPEIVRNFGELERALEGTRFEWMLRAG